MEKRLELEAETREDANQLIGTLSATLREMCARERVWVLELDITRVRKSPTLQHLKVLTHTLDELRPLLVQKLRRTTIVCSSQLQRFLIALVFKLHPPSTPIAVVKAQNPCPKSK
jgi:hypothetical protein